MLAIDVSIQNSSQISMTQGHQQSKRIFFSIQDAFEEKVPFLRIITDAY